MKQLHLKKIRVIIALIFIFLTACIFLDFREIFSTAIISGVVFLQFVPSVLKFITVLSLSATGFIVILVLTALFGRVYCSAICPLGILQDVITWITKKSRRKFRHKYSRPLDYLRYPLLALPIIVYLAGSVLVITLLDPFSNFGRIFSDLVRPAVIGTNNLLSRLLEKLDIYFLYSEQIHYGNVANYIFPVFLLGLVIWLSVKYGRLYCNTVCPVGTLLGLLSRISVFRIKILDFKCTKCAKCYFECKSSCISMKTLDVDFSRCVGCFNCISVCPEDAVKYVLPFRMAGQSSKTDTTRRKVLGMVGAGLAGLLGITPDLRSQSEVEPALSTKIKETKTHPVTPPGSMGIKHFTDTCTACHLCISACPTHVLQPSVFEYGITGLMQPYMDYHTNYCNFECTICSEVCPTGAILKITKEGKETTQLGQVHFIRENCVVYTEETACGSCSEHCPTQAVTMVPYIRDLTIPETRPELCVGCGACEYACPTTPYKAIYVDGHYEHQIAKKPDIEELEETELEEEFPF